jgi:hypothetical protein
MYAGMEHDFMLSKFLFFYLHVCIDVGLCHFRLGNRVFGVVEIFFIYKQKQKQLSVALVYTNKL